MSAVKGYAWAVVFFFACLIYITIPTYLIITFWEWLNETLYTYALLSLFVYIVTILISLIYFVAMIRAIVQRNSEDMGISKGVKGFGLVSVILIIGFMVFWYLKFNQIAFFSLTKPAIA
ncbi:MAG: hypothetical protein ACOC44_07890 [Promethearchaeia archaeon]